MSVTAATAAHAAQRMSFAEQVELLLTTAGPRITAAGAGLSDARQLAAWRKGREPRSDDHFERVGYLAEVVLAITAHYPPAVAAAFLRGSNPDLDDAAPFMVLREADADALSAAMARVRSAVTAFLDGEAG